MDSRSNLSTTQTLGVIREKNWGDNEQAFGPSSIPGNGNPNSPVPNGSINVFGSSYFPGVSIYNVFGEFQLRFGFGHIEHGPERRGAIA